MERTDTDIRNEIERLAARRHTIYLQQGHGEGSVFAEERRELDRRIDHLWEELRLVRSPRGRITESMRVRLLMFAYA